MGTLTILRQHTSNKVTTKVFLNIFVKHMHTQTHTHIHTHTHTLTLSHITVRWKNRRKKDMKCLWQELQENRRVLIEDFKFKDWNSKSNLRALCSFPFSDDFLLHTP